MKKVLICGLILITGSSAFAQNTGIGTLNPQAKLHVAGSMRLDTLSGGIGKHIVYADSAGNIITENAGLPNTQTAAGAIPEGCPAGGILRSITVSGLPAGVSSANIKLRVKINHTFDGDLAGYLLAPNGAILNLFFANGSSGDNFTNTVFWDGAASALPTTATGAPFTGNYKPTGNLSVTCGITPTVSTFAGIGGGTVVPNGVWSLKIFDLAAQDNGEIIDWGISFDGSQPPIPNYLQDGYTVRTANGGVTTGSIQDNGSGNITVPGNITTNTLTLNNVGVTGDFLIKDNTSTGVGSQKGMGGVGLNYIISLYGIFPTPGSGSPDYTKQMIGEIRLFAGNYPPNGWAFCQGQLLSVTAYSPLFNIIGTIYGGDGVTTFALPDLRGSVPVHPGTSPKGSSWVQGEKN